MANPAGAGGARDLLGNYEGRQVTTRPEPPQDIADARFRRAVERLHGLGPRAVFELLCEIGRARQCLTFIEQRVENCGRLDSRVLRALDGDRLPPAPIREVRR